MEGKESPGGAADGGATGRGNLLALSSPDPTLSLTGAIALASVAGSGLVVDFVGENNGKSLEQMLEDGPSHHDLSPGRTGIAVVPGHPATMPRSEGLLGELARRWPAVVIRVAGPVDWLPNVPVHPLVSARLGISRVPHGAAVWQPFGSVGSPPGPGPVLPRLRRRTVATILSGRLPVRSRWINAWRQVWAMPWV